MIFGKRDPPDMRITARGVNRSTLGRQLQLRRESLGVADAVRRVVAPQAASPYLALWNRLTDLDPADLDAAVACHEVVIFWFARGRCRFGLPLID
jgi:hypothetical protein